MAKNAEMSRRIALSGPVAQKKKKKKKKGDDDGGYM